MATIAMASKATTMNVIPTMTAVAMVRGLFMFCQIRPVTSVTVDLTVLTIEGKFSLGIVIEGPQQPGIGIVAVTTLLTHAPLMGLIGLVTGEAGGIRLLKFSTEMAGFASSNTVYSNEGKPCNVMLEKELYIPTAFIVTIATILTQFILVHIKRPVTGDTYSLFQTVHRHATMTGATYQILVFALERKLGVLSMIELHLGPAFRIVAILALFTIAPFVHIIFFMTGKAAL
jgi:hypothetical protein